MVPVFRRGGRNLGAGSIHDSNLTCNFDMSLLQLLVTCYRSFGHCLLQSDYTSILFFWPMSTVVVGPVSTTVLSSVYCSLVMRLL